MWPHLPILLNEEMGGRVSRSGSQKWQGRTEYDGFEKETNWESWNTETKPKAKTKRIPIAQKDTCTELSRQQKRILPQSTQSLRMTPPASLAWCSRPLMIRPNLPALCQSYPVQSSHWSPHTSDFASVANSAGGVLLPFPIQFWQFVLGLGSVSQSFFSACSP